MEQFIITHIDGSTISLRQRSTVINVTRATQSVELLGNDVVDISVESAVKLYFQIGDKITIVGRDYTLNIPPKETKLSENKFRYDLQFEGVQYDLSRATYDVNIDTTGSDLYADALTGNMKLFLDVLIANINRVFPGKWVLGTYPNDTETKTLTFSETDNCLAVLQRLCEEYNQEFDIAIAQNGTRTINIAQAGKTIAFTFQYGKGKGIYELTREKVSSSNIVNRLKVYGGSKNISSKYRATRLCLPGKNKAQSYIENAESIAKYGIWENAIYFEDIFPQRTGVVTALGDTVLKFIDNTMDFDLNEKEADGVTTKYLLAGTPAKVHFNTGNLAGYEFEITSYDHATKTFTIKSFKDERDMEFPSQTSPAFQFSVGDEYVLIDISMPQSYIDAAEQKLLEKGQEYLSQNCQPKVQYSLILDEFFLKKTFGTEAESNIFWVGDYIPIKDSDIEVDKLIRVKGFTRDLLKECSYNLTISDLAVTRSIYNRIISDLIDIDKIIQINDLANVAKARRNWLNAQEILGMVFDVEGDYYTDKIKPQSIETMMLSVGAKSMQFVLVGTVFQPNYGGNKNRIVYKGGTLTHYAIVDEDNNPRYWVLQNGDITVTNDFQAYYIYAKCEKNGTGGTILFSAQQIQAEQDANYYHFLIGVLNSVDSELQVRSISLMYGFTTINGKFVRTGVIESTDGSCILDLDGNRLILGDSNSELSWNKNSDRKLRLKGTLVQSTSGDEFPIGVFRGEFNASYIYYKGDQITYNGSTWIYIADVSTSGETPYIGSTFWGLVAAKGEQGIQGIPGADGADGAAGKDAKYVVLTASQLAIAFDTAGNNPSPSSVTLTAISYNLQGTAYYEFFDNDVSLGSPSTSNTKNLSLSGKTFSNMPRKIEVQVREGSSSGTIVARDQMSIVGMKAGDNTVQAVIDNAAHTVPSDENGNVTSYAGSGCKIQVYEGATQLQYNTTLANGKFNIGTPTVSPAGKITVGARSGSGTNTCTVANHSAMDAATDLVTITYPITVKKADGQTVTFNLIQTVTKSKKGNKGDQGIPGNDGNDGPFVEYRYAKNGSTSTPPSLTVTDLNPSGWSTTPPSVGYLEYLWMTKAKKNYSGTNLIENWSTPVRIKGDQGDKGDKGDTGDLGASPVFRGTYSASNTYYGNSKRVDIVKYNSNYYVARTDAGTFSNKIPTNTSYWNEFGSQFESIATNLLLAEGANIADWIIVNAKITSQNETSDGTPRAQMDGVNGKINFASDIQRYTEGAGLEYVKQTIKIDSLSGVIESRTTDGDVAKITSQGIFANKAGYEVAGMGVSLKAAIAGFGYGKMDKDMWGSNWGIAGIYGYAKNSSSNPAPAYAAYLDGDTKITGLFMPINGIKFPEIVLDDDTTYFYLNKSHFHVTHYGTESKKYIYLPSSSNRYVGQMFMIVRINSFRLYIRGNGATIFKGTGEYDEVEIGDARNTLVLFWCGDRWIANEIPR